MGLVRLVECSENTGCSSVGRMRGWGSRDRWFESSHPDKEQILIIFDNANAIVRHDFRPRSFNKSKN